MYQFRIKEELYENGTSLYYPQFYFIQDEWKNLDNKLYFNYDDALNTITKFKDNLNKNNTLKEIKIHYLK